MQLDQSSTRRQGGTGLGLHLCKQLADLVDGHMALAETPGGGCTFSLTIPAEITPGAEPIATEAPRAAIAAGEVAPSPFGNVRARPAEFGLPLPEPVR